MPKAREPLIAHRLGRNKLLGALGFSRQQAEWITLVCLHSGLFTRDQLAFYRLGANRFYVRRCVNALLDCQVSAPPFADERVADGRLICSIFGQQIYRLLEIPHIRHRREISLEVTRWQLLSLDFVLDHLDLPRLATEQEKVACLEQLDIVPKLFPKRIYYGRANGRVRYFHIKMPVAFEQDRAVFTYIDPGMGTRTELDS